MTSLPPIAAQVETIKVVLKGWLAKRLSTDALAWLDEQMRLIAASDRPQQLGIAIGLAPRKVGKFDLDLSSGEKAAAHIARRNLDTTGWSLDQTARMLLVLASFDGDDAAFSSKLNQVFVSAEIGEQIALLRGLPLYPSAKLLLPRATDGVRSAMQPVFEAVAHRNPYPREQFDEAQWNQMVVKALFIGSTLAPIQGLDERRNSDLALMLFDYARERRAAGRSTSPELWRCVGPFLGAIEVRELADVLSGGAVLEARAAALALYECPLPEAGTVLRSAPELAAEIQNGHLTWNHIT